MTHCLTVLAGRWPQGQLLAAVGRGRVKGRSCLQPAPSLTPLDLPRATIPGTPGRWLKQHCRAQWAERMNLEVSRHRKEKERKLRGKNSTRGKKRKNMTWKWILRHFRIYMKEADRAKVNPLARPSKCMAWRDICSTFFQQIHWGSSHQDIHPGPPKK